MSVQTRGSLSHFLGDKTDTPPYVRAAKGFSDLSDSIDPQVKEATYIDDTTESTTIALKRSWSFSGDRYTENPANDMLYELTRSRAKGDDAVVYMVNVEEWEPSANNPDTVFRAEKWKCSWAPTSGGGGTGGESVTFAGTLNGKGDPVDGWATVTKDPDPDIPWTCTFSIDEPEAIA
jgi:hypothetical protein